MKTIAAILLVLAMATAKSAIACPDETYRTVPQEAKQARWVVVGRMLNEQYSAEGPGNGWVDGTFYTIKVEKVLKGSPVKTLRVFSENSSGRFPLESQTPYLLLVAPCDGVLYVEAKGNSAPMSSANSQMKVLQSIFKRGR